MSSQLIEIDQVTKIFDTVDSDEGLVALDSIDLQIGESEFVTFVGPSGCGKTTMLRLITGLTQPTKGTVSVRGEEVSEPISDVGYVFQSAVLMDWRNVRQNVMFPYEALASADDLDRDEAFYESRMEDLLELVGLEDFKQAYPKQLSGGMQQRVAICRALLPDPPILLMDEPFGALDAFTREELNVQLLEIWKETDKTILFVTHNVEEAVFLADRVVVLSPRPGQISSVIDVDLERPRSLDVRQTQAFTELMASVREELQVH